MVGKLWVMVAARGLFFYAQRYAGMWRVWMLVVSIAMVAHICWRTFGKQGLVQISILATVYLGVFLPTLAIGYNQYACIEYGRRGLYTLEPLRGVFYIKDAKTDKVGLRDSTVLYNIDLKTARQSTPQQEELDELAKRIETVLK